MALNKTYNLLHSKEIINKIKNYLWNGRKYLQMMQLIKS